MLSDKEILVQGLEKYATNIASRLFGLSSIPSQTLIKYAVRNMYDKYGKVIDLFADKNGMINTDLMLDALKAEIKNRDGFKFMNIKFNTADVDELRDILTQLKNNNA